MTNIQKYLLEKSGMQPIDNSPKLKTKPHLGRN